MRITLNVILRAVFGADGAELRATARAHPAVGDAGLAAGRAAHAETRLRPVQPVGHGWPSIGAQYDAVDRHADRPGERRDPQLRRSHRRAALLLRSTYDDGSAMSRSEIGDELLTLLAAGHETTASTLAWAFERISRHPEVLAAAGRGGRDRRQRATARRRSWRSSGPDGDRLRRPARLRRRSTNSANGVIPQGYSILVSICAAAREPRRYSPTRSGSTRSGSSATRPQHVRVGSVRRRHPALRRRGVRQHGDGRGAANGVAPLHHRDHDRAGREVAFAAVWRSPRRRAAASCVHRR